MPQSFTDIFEKVSNSENLSSEEARFSLEQMVAGELSHEEVAAFLFGMRTKGETVEELTEFVRVMREATLGVDVDQTGAVDLCGTGGDRSGTFNISTASMFVVAGAGVPVLKHGNRSVSSKCGSADVLEELGVSVTLKKQGVEQVFRETGLAFMFAPNFHPAMKHVMPARRALKLRTFFNILGPLLNPAGVRRQVVGAYSPEVAQKMIRILSNLETEDAVTLHAEDGLDEISVTADTRIFKLEHAQDGEFMRFSPSQLGISRSRPEQLVGGDASHNAGIIRAILEGRASEAQTNVTLLNATFGIHVSGAADSLEESFKMAQESIGSGSGADKLKTFAEASREAATS